MSTDNRHDDEPVTAHDSCRTAGRSSTARLRNPDCRDSIVIDQEDGGYCLDNPTAFMEWYTKDQAAAFRTLSKMYHERADAYTELGLARQQTVVLKQRLQEWEDRDVSFDPAERFEVECESLDSLYTLKSGSFARNGTRSNSPYVILDMFFAKIRRRPPSLVPRRNPHHCPMPQSWKMERQYVSRPGAGRSPTNSF